MLLIKSNKIFGKKMVIKPELYASLGVNIKISSRKYCVPLLEMLIVTIFFFLKLAVDEIQSILFCDLNYVL